MAEATDFSVLPWDVFLRAEGLPDAYRESATKWFSPLIEQIALRHQANPGPLLLGINGSQGSGKSTLAAFLAMAMPPLTGQRVCVLSIDDFYLTRDERLRLAREVHPLLATRGVPGTHDTDLLAAVLDALLAGRSAAIPRFDKAIDDRIPEADWQQLEEPVDLIVWEGWCLGVPAQPEHMLDAPVNTLESDEDDAGHWRRWVNAQLADSYQSLFARVGCWAMLAAPSFDCVHRWRSEQEAKLIARRGADHPGLMTEADIRRFIQHYQRLTEWGLEVLPPRMDFFWPLDEQRQISACRRPREALA
jgi:D-glycerate 3-kinase